MTTARAHKPRPAQQPARRTVHVLIDKGDYAGWECTAYADFKAKHLADFQSEDMTRILAFLDANVTEHNFPDADDPDKLAETIGDVDNAALAVVCNAIFDAIAKLPNR